MNVSTNVGRYFLNLIKKQSATFVCQTWNRESATFVCQTWNRESTYLTRQWQTRSCQLKQEHVTV